VRFQIRTKEKIKDEDKEKSTVKDTVVKTIIYDNYTGGSIICPPTLTHLSGVSNLIQGYLCYEDKTTKEWIEYMGQDQSKDFPSYTSRITV
jgi:hypothetical protein